MTKSPVFLSSERLHIKQAEENDAGKIVDYYVRNREYLKPFEPIRPDIFFTVEFWKEQIKQGTIDFNNDSAVRFFVYDNSNNDRIIGVINYSNFIRGVFQAAYLGYSIDEHFQGRGLMTEAVQTSVHYIFSQLNFHRIMANCMVSNKASLALLKKIGFEIEGTAKAYLQINGKWEDHILTALINTEYKE